MNLRLTLRVCIWLMLLLSGSAAWAHDARPAYLEIKETSPGRYNIFWRSPLMNGVRLPVVLKLPDDVRNITAPAVQELPDSIIERRIIEVDDGLAGKRIDFVGLEATITDALVR